MLDDIQRIESGTGPLNPIASTAKLTLSTYALQAIIVLSVWLFYRPYTGIVHDSRIYIGRALANLDPNGLGREALFSLDGQTKFTIYSRLIQPLVQVVGASTASIILTLLGLSIWLAAAAWLASRLVPSKFVAAALIFVALLPASYGPFSIFSYAESFAVPRVVAEAAVLAGVAALIDRRLLISFALLACSVVFHPIMALAGLGCALVILAIEDRRWWLAIPLGAAAVVIAAVLHIGPTKTLFATFDPAWLAAVKMRNPFLFETRWPIETWSHVIVVCTTVMIAGLMTRGRIRVLLIASVVIALGGVIGTYALGDLTSNILMVDLQLWRVLWLPQCLVGVMTPFCAWKLISERRIGGILTFILLICAWGAWDHVLLAAMFCTAALLVFATGFKKTAPSHKLLIYALVSVLILIGVFYSVEDWLVFSILAKAALSAGAPIPFTFLAKSSFIRIVLASIVVLSLLSSPYVWGTERMKAVLACALLIVMSMLWFRPTPTRTMIDNKMAAAELNAAIGSTPNGVFWDVGDDVAPLFWLGRPTWLNTLQGTTGVFSRPLSLQWYKRSSALMKSGLGRASDFDPWSKRTPEPLLSPNSAHEGILRLCHSIGGPSVIVTLGDISKTFAPSKARAWTPPKIDYTIDVSNGHPRYIRMQTYTIIRCADVL